MVDRIPYHIFLNLFIKLKADRLKLTISAL